jgi:hypothetical protein
MSKKLYRILVSGWREFPPIGHVESKLGPRIQHLQKFGDVEIVVGDALGVDKVTRDWCKLNKILCTEFKANWKRFGMSAGPRRNREMVKYAMEADECELYAFPHIRRSIGTVDMMDWCRFKKITVNVFEILD